MKIVVLGAGFTGLTAAYELTKKGHEVIVLEQNDKVGGIAGGFKEKGWDYYLDYVYHHLFTKDLAALNLAKEVNQKLTTYSPLTKVLVNGELLCFDSPQALLVFPHLPFIDKLRTGLGLFYLRYLSNLKSLSNLEALPWLKKMMGKKVTELIWEPLFLGKFGDFTNQITLSWFGARIKKRTPNLVYPEGGFQEFADKIALKVKEQGGKIVLNTKVTGLVKEATGFNIRTDHQAYQADQVICTLPSPTTLALSPNFPENIKKLAKIPHLSALNLILELDKPFFKDQTYWLNITDKSFPFLALVEHTNLIPAKNYFGKHILYIGNYLKDDHPYLKMTAHQLLKVFEPFLKTLNPTYHLSLVTSHLNTFNNAQPVVTANYIDLLPDTKTDLPGFYLANMDLVYPWDRGVNYAIELGKKVAKFCE